MKKLILLAIIVGAFSLNFHADYDPLDDPNSLQFKKAAAAEQARAAKKKAETDEKIRVTRVAALRKDMGKQAVGKSDAEVEAIYSAGINDAKRQAAAVNAATARQTKKSGTSEQQQAEAMMKALTGSNSADVANMSSKERDAFAREMEKKYAGKQ